MAQVLARVQHWQLVRAWALHLAQSGSGSDSTTNSGSGFLGFTSG
jgi:hypothetical protein